MSAASRSDKFPYASAGLTTCWSCGTPRGNKTRDWVPILENAVMVGYSCPSCPEATEPIRRVSTRSGVRYRAVVRSSPKGAPLKQATFTADTLDAARQWVTDVRAKADAGGYARQREQATVREYADRWLNTRGTMRKVTLQGYRNALRCVLVHLGDRKVSTLRKSDILAFIAWAVREGGVKGRPLSGSSVDYSLITLWQVLDMAHDDGIITAEALHSLKALKKTERPKAIDKTEKMPTAKWTVEQVEKFREVSDEHTFAGVWRLALVGLTRADVHGLRWSDLDLDKGIVTIRQGRVALQGGESDTFNPKSRQRRRSIPFEKLRPGTVTLLRALKEKQDLERDFLGSAWSNTGFVVVDALGRPMHPERWSESFQRMANMEGLPKIKLHALRHSFAHWCHYVLRVPDAVTAAWLGHTLPVFQMTYLPRADWTEFEELAEIAGRWLTEHAMAS